MGNTADYRNYAPAKTSRIPEAIEWTQTYAYGTDRPDLPRVLLIGDSIVVGYHDGVRKELEGRMTVSYWSTSKCVTSQDYFREMDLIVKAYRYDIVCFNNGLHSLSSDRGEWEAAYDAALRFLRDALPEAKLFVTLCTPLENGTRSCISRELSDYAQKEAEKYGLPVIDLFSQTDALDHTALWADGTHFRPEVRAMQAKWVAEAVCP